MRISVSLRGTRRTLLPLIALGVIVGCVLPAASVAAPTPAVSAPSSSLTAQFWQTLVAVPASDAATRCDLGTGNVVFLGATGTGTVRSSCTLAAGTSVLLPLINIECSSLEVDTPFFGRTPAERVACAKDVADGFTSLSLKINGTKIGGLNQLRVASQFVFSPVDGNLFGIPPGTGSSATDGYWALIGPLAPGDYDVMAGGTYPPAHFTTKITLRLHVV